MSLRLSFHGGAGTVTGSRHLLEAPGSTILVDAGLFQGLKALRLRNWSPPTFDPRAVDHLLLTHTHIDHAGYLPRLVKEGYRGPVYCSVGTKDLAKILLMDAAKIQEEDAEHANRRGYSKHRPALPLFTAEDAERALKLFKAAKYEKWIPLGKNVRARFLNAGHILGSAMAEVRVTTPGREIGIVFSGDIGKYDMPLHPDPTDRPACDFVVVESTYGDRVHDDTPFMDQLRDPLIETFKEKGTVLIPAFAVARAQIVTLILSEAMKRGEIPEVPLHIDSPMAVDATEVYRRHLGHECLDPDLISEHRSRLFPKNVELHRSREDSMRLNDAKGPRIIISSSGMLAGGRVLHHLRRILPDRKNLLILVGYQAMGTRGRALIDGKRSLKVHGRQVPVKARFLVAHGLSAHADQNELLRWMKSSDQVPSGVFVVHGEPDSSAAFADLVHRETGAPTYTPALEDGFDLLDLLGDA